MEEMKTIDVPVNISGLEQLKSLTNLLESQVSQVNKTVEKISELKLKIEI